MAERALHGVNLTGWLTLEPWVTPELFVDSGALEEPDLVSAVGCRGYNDRVSRHRASFLGESDFRQIAARGFNAVRLPVPWYVFGDAGPNPGPFLGCVDLVDAAFDWADGIGLKVVLALAVNPGAEGHEADLVHDHDDFRRYRDDLVSVVAALAKRYASRVAFSAIEVADEPAMQVRRGLSVIPGVPPHQLRNYYRSCYEAVRGIAGEDLVVVVPDAGQPGAWRHFMSQDRYHNVWLDSHLYHYADHVDSSGPVGIRMLTDRSRKSVELAGSSGLPVMVGKWCASLPFSDTVTTPEGRIALERVFSSEQIGAFRSCPAWFFQTWKTEGRLPGWDARVALASFERRMLG